MAAAAESAGLSGDNIVSAQIDKKARNLGKSKVFLDDANTRLNDSANVPLGEQISLLTNVMEQYDGLGADMKSFADSWQAGDIAPLSNIKASIYSMYEDGTGDALIDRRNERWADQFVQFMQGTEDGFAAVDINHLLGNDSLQFLLREQGYTVRRYRGSSPAD